MLSQKKGRERDDVVTLNFCLGAHHGRRVGLLEDGVTVDLGHGGGGFCVQVQDPEPGGESGMVAAAERDERADDNRKLWCDLRGDGTGVRGKGHAGRGSPSNAICANLQHGTLRSLRRREKHSDVSSSAEIKLAT